MFEGSGRLIEYWQIYGHPTEEAFLVERDELRNKIASLSAENRIRKATIILGRQDGTSINSRVAYLADFCSIDINEVLQALDNAVQNETMWV